MYSLLISECNVCLPVSADARDDDIGLQSQAAKGWMERAALGGKKMVFLSDPVQLKPVMGDPIYARGKGGYEKVAIARGARGRRQKLYHSTVGKSCTEGICWQTV